MITDTATQKKVIRVSALMHYALGMSRVKVIFRAGGYEWPKGEESAYWMTQETYHAIPLGVEATLEDYKAHGEVVEASDTDIYSLK
jgi:hypothetical protein